MIHYHGTPIGGTRMDVVRFLAGRHALVPFARPDDLGAALEYLVSNFRTVALGSSGQWASPGTDAWWQRMAEAMQVACDDQGRPRARLHGLRMLDPTIFTQLPLSSADSTNAAVNCGAVKRFGMYPAPTASQRADVIASRIEAHQSAAAWLQVPTQQPIELFAGDRHAG